MNKKYQGGGLVPNLTYAQPIPRYLGAPLDEVRESLNILQDRSDKGFEALALGNDAVSKVPAIPGSPDAEYVAQKRLRYQELMENMSDAAMENPTVYNQTIREIQSLIGDPNLANIANSHAAYLQSMQLMQKMRAEGTLEENLTPDFSKHNTLTDGIFGLAPVQHVSDEEWINQQINDVGFDSDGNWIGISEKKVRERAVRTTFDFLNTPAGRQWRMRAEKALGRKMTRTELTKGAADYLEDQYSEIIQGRAAAAKGGSGGGGGAGDVDAPEGHGGISTVAQAIDWVEGSSTAEQVIDRINQLNESVPSMMQALESEYEISGDAVYEVGDEDKIDRSREYRLRKQSIENVRQFAEARQRSLDRILSENAKAAGFDIDSQSGLSIETISKEAGAMYEDLFRGVVVSSGNAGTPIQVGAGLQGGPPPSTPRKSFEELMREAPPERIQGWRDATIRAMRQQNPQFAHFYEGVMKDVDSQMNTEYTWSNERMVDVTTDENNLTSGQVPQGNLLQSRVISLATDMKSLRAINPNSGESDAVTLAVKENTATYKGGGVNIRPEAEYRLVSFGYSEMAGDSGGFYARLEVLNPNDKKDPKKGYSSGGHIIVTDNPGSSGLHDAIMQYMPVSSTAAVLAAPVQRALNGGADAIEMSGDELFMSMGDQKPEMAEELSGVNIKIKRRKADNPNSGVTLIVTNPLGERDYMDFDNATQAYEALMKGVYYPVFNKYMTPDGENNGFDEDAYFQRNYGRLDSSYDGGNLDDDENDINASVARASSELGVNKDDLMTLIGFETGGSYSPSQRNKAGSGATGLIQFMPSTAKALGVTTDELADMSVDEQMDYVIEYLKPYASRIRNKGDLAMAVFFPAAIGKPDSFSIVDYYRRIGKPDVARKFMEQNPGIITRGDYLRKAGMS